MPSQPNSGGNMGTYLTRSLMMDTTFVQPFSHLPYQRHLLQDLIVCGAFVFIMTPVDPILPFLQLVMG
jgi:hypothetical protein